jgi:cyclopropane fatty-acyl-phospholipid synthase-like methyltransferase
MTTRVRRRVAWWLRSRVRRKLRMSKINPRRAESRAALVGAPELWAGQRQFQFDFLTGHGLRPTQRLIDIGCGVLRVGIPLIDYLETGNYTGVEIRAEVLKEARKELRKCGLEHKQPHLIHATDPMQIEPGPPFDFAWAFMVLIHMSDDIADTYMRFISQRLSEDGVFYANVAGGPRPDGEWQGFPVVFRAVTFYERIASSHGLSVTRLGPLGSLGYELAPGRNSMMLQISRAPAV